MSKLITIPNLANPDATYELLLSAHNGLGDDESAEFNVRLLLTLVNHIGDMDVLAEAISVAKSASPAA